MELSGEGMHILDARFSMPIHPTREHGSRWICKSCYDLCNEALTTTLLRRGLLSSSCSVRHTSSQVCGHFLIWAYPESLQSSPHNACVVQRSTERFLQRQAYIISGLRRKVSSRKVQRYWRTFAQSRQTTRALAIQFVATRVTSLQLPAPDEVGAYCAEMSAGMLPTNVIVAWLSLA